MKPYKSEREWSDLERADKVALFVGLLIWAMLAVTAYKQSARYSQIKNNAVKSEMVRTR